MKYPVVIEKAGKNFSGYCPDLPGCIATGRTRPETLRRLQKAVTFHLRGLKEDRLPIPKPSTSVAYITVAA
jgi:predicted RNase H-like HicB family nuclease